MFLRCTCHALAMSLPCSCRSGLIRQRRENDHKVSCLCKDWRRE
jgi:hypothetical protein